MLDIALTNLVSKTFGSMLLEKGTYLYLGSIRSTALRRDFKK